MAREVRPRQRRRGPDRGHDVHDQREVQHLLDRDAGHGLLPSRDRVGLPGGQTLVRVSLKAEAGIQVLAHDHVLDLRRLDQQAPQLLTVLDHKPCLSHHRSQGKLG